MNYTNLEDERCAFASKGTSNEYNGCKALTIGECDGLDETCSFRKTQAQLIKENDRSIDRHRKLQMCRECKYHKWPCVKSNEVCEHDGRAD